MEEQKIIIYNTADGKTAVSLLAKDGSVWMNQSQIAELFATSKQNIGQHIANILEDIELDVNSVVKNYFTTATDGKNYALEKRLDPQFYIPESAELERKVLAKKPKRLCGKRFKRCYSTR